MVCTGKFKLKLFPSTYRFPDQAAPCNTPVTKNVKLFRLTSQRGSQVQPNKHDGVKDNKKYQLFIVFNLLQ